MNSSPTGKWFDLFLTTSLSLQLAVLSLSYVALGIDSTMPVVTYFDEGGTMLSNLAAYYFLAAALLWCITSAVILVKRPELNVRNTVTALLPLFALVFIRYGFIPYPFGSG